MAKLLVVFLLLLIAVSLVSCEVEFAEMKGEMVRRNHRQYHKGGHGPGSLKSYQCPAACSRRCGRTQYKKPCLFFCQKCCRTCLCVPPGFYGNKQVCPCYNNWKTKSGGPKCP